MQTLRPYQTQGINKIFQAWRTDKRSILFQMPTGTGKTVLFAEIVRMGFEKKRKILIVVHRRELIEQIRQKLDERNIELALIVAGQNLDYTKEIQIASIQTLTRREHPEADLIIIDECHHAKAASYRKLWEIYPKAKFLGVTATPIRLNGEGFTDLFDFLITSMSVQEFIDQDFLVPVAQYSSETPDLSGLKIRQGDYATNELSEIMMEGQLMADLIESYQELCPGKSMIVFAVNIEHSKEIAKRYYGVPHQ
jgi:superfamily II DNA or RNA helicase